MKTIAFHTNTDKPEAEAAMTSLSRRAAAAGMSVVPADGRVRPDAVIALGGDGTMLAAVHAFPGIPVLGLNLGSLGFLSAVEKPHFEKAVDDLAAGRYSIAHRTALSSHIVRADGSRTDDLPDALNDVVVTRATPGHAACMEACVDGAPMTSFLADGIIVATPTGSTAYSLAAGGPVLMPGSSCIVLTPACPHALSSRPIVLPDAVELSIRAIPKSRSVPAHSLAVSADGASTAVAVPGDTVTVRKSTRTVPLVELNGRNPYETLGRKLGWSGRFPGIDGQ